ncbi:hypothetical protein VNO78_29735 [Psophocarpus tetragonolobus]|uniref:Uncharacterized protein n=1 Tax=Psophocarpus tetragonolobus TaxID=3891 RepID=A0AAN9RVJ5_PSOTE
MVHAGARARALVRAACQSAGARAACQGAGARARALPARALVCARALPARALVRARALPARALVRAARDMPARALVRAARDMPARALVRARARCLPGRWPLCHLQYPVAYLSRLQRILPAARWELRFKASHRANPPCEGRQRHVPLGGRGPLLLVGKRTTGARVASSPDSDLEAFSHNPTHGSFAPLAFQPSAMTNCANQRFLSY